VPQNKPQGRRPAADAKRLQLAQERGLGRARTRVRCVMVTGAGISTGSSMAIVMVRLRLGGRVEPRKGSNPEAGREGRLMVISENPRTS
jgi:hypothetical protein